MRRIGVVAVLAGLFVAGLSATTIRADPATTSETTTEVMTTTASTDTTTTTTTATTTTETSATTTTTPATTGATTTTTSTTTAAATTALTTTTGPTTTATVAKKATKSAAPPISGPCPFVGGIAVLSPGRPARILGPAAQTRRVQKLGGGGVAYPAGGSIATASSVTVTTSRCAGSALVRSVSLFGGAVTAETVELVVRGDELAKASHISGLSVGGVRAGGAPGRRVPIGGWGYATAFPSFGATRAALSVSILRSHGGLPAGSIVVVGFAGLPTPRRVVTPAAAARAKRTARATARRRHRRHLAELGAPLSVTPPLGLRRYVFPVVGESDYIDTYGAFRGDVPGNWHHGDDIFAPIGAPVVAVANGTLNRVGWQRLGGWRLWVRDRLGNEFYYAHLSGYSPLALRSRLVRAGEVIGFIGNTGDAFTTSPHLHFEVHPRGLLYLQYNGAVDPTSYLNDWQRLRGVAAPVPAHPDFPAGAVRAEASYVWRELLAARGLTRHAPRPSERPTIALPGFGVQLDAPPLGLPTPSLSAATAGGGSMPVPLVASLLAAMGAASAGLLLVRRRRAASSDDGADEPTIADALQRLALVGRLLRERA